MLALTIHFRLKPNATIELTETMEKEIIPWLRQQQGFQDEITFVVPDGRSAIGISLWDRKEKTGAYDKSIYPKILKALLHVVRGTPTMGTYEVFNSTFHAIPDQE
jgi:hypothetical protein